MENKCRYILSKSIDCAVPRVNCFVNDGLQANDVLMYVHQLQLMSTLGYVDGGGGYAHVGAGVCGKCLYLSLISIFSVICMSALG